jgi:hypothetical protein
MCAGQGNFHAHTPSIPALAWVIAKMDPTTEKEILKAILELEYGEGDDIFYGLGGGDSGQGAGSHAPPDGAAPGHLGKGLRLDTGDEDDDLDDEHSQIDSPPKRQMGGTFSVNAAETGGEGSSSPSKRANIAYIDLTKE